MFTQLYIIVSIISVLLIGFIILFYKRQKQIKLITFLEEYRDNYLYMAEAYFNISYEAARHVDLEKYNWSTYNIDKLSKAVRASGIYFNSNTLARFQTGNIKPNEGNSINNLLMRSIGFYKDAKENYSSDLRNPLTWFQYGVKFFSDIFLKFLSSIKIINGKSIQTLKTNWLFNFLSTIIYIIGVVGSITGLVTSWKSFIEILQNIGVK